MTTSWRRFLNWLSLVLLICKWCEFSVRQERKAFCLIVMMMIIWWWWWWWWWYLWCEFLSGLEHSKTTLIRWWCDVSREYETVLVSSTLFSVSWTRTTSAVFLRDCSPTRKVWSYCKLENNSLNPFFYSCTMNLCAGLYMITNCAAFLIGYSLHWKLWPLCK